MGAAVSSVRMGRLRSMARQLGCKWPSVSARLADLRLREYGPGDDRRRASDANAATVMEGMLRRVGLFELAAVDMMIKCMSARGYLFVDPASFRWPDRCIELSAYVLRGGILCGPRFSAEYCSPGSPDRGWVWCIRDREKGNIVAWYEDAWECAKCWHFAEKNTYYGDSLNGREMPTAAELLDTPEAYANRCANMAMCDAWLELDRYYANAKGIVR